MFGGLFRASRIEPSLGSHRWDRLAWRWSEGAWAGRPKFLASSSILRPALRWERSWTTCSLGVHAAQVATGSVRVVSVAANI